MRKRAVLPAYFREPESTVFDAGLVTNRAVALVHAIRLRRVNAYVPPSFYREFLNVATRPLNESPPSVEGEASPAPTGSSASGSGASAVWAARAGCRRRAGRAGATSGRSSTMAVM